jgi:hypothetical protein
MQDNIFGFIILLSIVGACWLLTVLGTTNAALLGLL